ncbi:MAG TPA: hypothetical protein VN672_09605 [Solirubrobacteraceae bacterium]|nr:hypothetical protein [Solirubrobacteraceae bacterium]
MSSEEQSRKITPALGSRMREDDADPLLDVIVELASDPADRSIPEAREAFEKAVEPVSSTIRRYGGEVTGGAWLNRTLRAKLPATSVHALTGLHEVAAIDVPHHVTRG